MEYGYDSPKKQRKVEIGIYIDAEDAEKLKQIASKYGLSMSSYVRLLIKKAIAEG